MDDEGESLEVKNTNTPPHLVLACWVLWEVEVSSQAQSLEEEAWQQAA